MANTMPELNGSRHLLLPENADAMAKGDLRKTEKSTWRLLGLAVERTRNLARLSAKEFADRVGRDERQVRAWIAGDEQPQIAAVFAVEAFRPFVVIALAELAGVDVDVTTHVTVRRAG